MVDFKLWPHQEQCIERARTMPYFALHFSPGCGKTLTAIQIMRERFNRERRIMRTLIFTPPIVVENFREEWLRYTKIDRSNVIALKGSGVQRVKEFKKHAYNDKGERTGKVFITNYESIRMDPLYEEFKKWSPDIYVMDESHKMKNPTAKTSKLLAELVNKYTTPSLRLNLTGTPILNTPMDLFQQFLILMGGFPTLESMVTGKHIQNYYHFLKLYFEDRNARWKGQDNYFPNFQPKASTNDLFGRLLGAVSMSVELKDCIQMPPEIDVTVPCPLTPEQRRDYDAFAKEMVLKIEGKAYTADIALTKALRLMQISSGFISGLESPDGAEMQPIKHEYRNTTRDENLRELLQQICIEGDSKTLCWAVWAHNYSSIKRACEELKIKYVCCTGLESSKEKEIARKTFIEDPSIKVWVGNPLSSGIGINLVVARYSIWYSRNFSLEQLIQAKARNFRAGQTETVIHYHLVSPETLEPDILQALQNKDDIAELILNKTNMYKK